VNSSVSASQIVEVSLAEAGRRRRTASSAAWVLQRSDAQCKTSSNAQAVPDELEVTLEGCASWAVNSGRCSPWITYWAEWGECSCVQKREECQISSTVGTGWVVSVYTVHIGSSPSPPPPPTPPPPTQPPAGGLPRDIFNEWMQFGENHHIAQGGYACGYKDGWCGCSCGHNLGANVHCTLPYIGPGVEGGHTCGSYGNLYGCAEAHYLSSYCPKSSR